jgi:ubiquinone/menaquinone biosynthesis C-methylase UbiE
MATTPEQSKSESAYFIRDSGAELARLVGQEHALAKALGGLLPEHPDSSAFLAPFHRLLDAACGSGGWVLSIAQAYPHLQVMGFDIDARMIAYANTQAQVGGLSNASFQVMDARQPLDYPADFFDLVNARWLGGIGPDKWTSAIREFLRITRPGGTIRLTETETFSLTNGPAFEKLSSLFTQALKRAGLSLSPDGRSYGITPMLGRFMRDAGCQNIQRKPFVVDWSAGMEAHDVIAEDIRVLIKLLQPFLIKTGMTTQEEFDQLYQEAELEMLSDDFCALWNFLTVWGEKP